MKTTIRIVLLGLIALQVLTAASRIQIQPNRFYELDLRYNNLQSSQTVYVLERPFLTQPLPKDAFLFQIQPSISLESGESVPSLTSWMQLELKSGYLLVNEMQFGYDSDLDSTYIGKEWRGARGETVQSFLQWSNAWKTDSEFLVRAGRVYSQLGPGRHGQLLLGSRSRPLDQISFSYLRNLSKSLSARFYYQTATLDKINFNKRFLSLHRFEILGKNWYINFSEALLYSRHNQGVDAVYLNPFLFYHGVQLNGPDMEGNTIGTVEIGYSWLTNHIYGEVLIDDVQLDNEENGDLEPNEVGMLAGFERAGENHYLSVEAVAITNRTYKTPDRTEWFLHRNIPIGYELGSDVARLNLLNRYYFKEGWHLDTELDVIWRGEGNMNKAWDTPWVDPSVTIESGYSESFPTGIVEQSTRLLAEVLHHWTAERWISVGLSYESIQNVDNIEDANDKGLQFKLGASWTLDYEFDFKH